MKMKFRWFRINTNEQKAESYVRTCEAGVKGGAAPFKKDDVILRARPQTFLRPKDLVTTELFLGRRGAGDVVCTAPTQLKVYEYENHCVVQNYTVTFYIILPIKSSNNYVCL